MSASGAGLRRVSVHAGTAVVDLSLPDAIPVAALLPPIVDIVAGDGGSDGLAARRYQLCMPGASALDVSRTLAQNDIRDGAVLVLSEARTPPPAARYDDVAEAVSATLAHSNQRQDRKATRLMGAVAASCLTGIGALALTRKAFGANGTQPVTTAGVAALAGFVALVFAIVANRTHREPVAGLTLGVNATAFAALAGVLAVPAAPDVPGVLLAAMAAAVMSVLAMRLSGCGMVTLTAVSCFTMTAAVAALVGVVTAAPVHVLGSVSALSSLGLLGVAARVSIALAGLSPRLPPAPDPDTSDGLSAKAIRADHWLTSLVAAFSSSAAVGAIVTILSAGPRPGRIALATVTGALLLSYARGNDRRRALIFVITGTATTGTTLAVIAGSIPGPWLAALTAMLAAAAMFVGFVAPTLSPSPVARRSVELLESLALIAMVPLTCWTCGLYAAVRGFYPKWG